MSPALVSLFAAYVSAQLLALPRDSPGSSSHAAHPRVIVTLRDGVQLKEHLLQTFSDAIEVIHHFDLDDYVGYVAHVHDSQLATLSSHQDIARVEEDHKYSFDDLHSHQSSSSDCGPTSEEGIDIGVADRYDHDQTLPTHHEARGLHRVLETQSHAPYYLNLISHREISDADQYVYKPPGGLHTYAYIVDTGLNFKHQEFADRALEGHTSFKDASPKDRVGHGTHVAGVIGGKTFGVAKHCELVNVKVFKGVYAWTSSIMDGIAWSVKDIQHENRLDKAVIHLALIPACSWSINRLIRAATKHKVTVVIAAGNTARVAQWTTQAIAVGATDRVRKRAPWSNYGPRVSLFAPGVDIKSAWIGLRDATHIMSGTSQASAQTAGVLLNFMSASPMAGLNTTKAHLLALATKDVVDDAKSSPNLFLYNDSGF